VAPAGIQRHEIPASKLGLRATPTSRLAGGTPDENAATIEAIFRGEPGSKRDVVLLNAGAALLVAGAVEQLEDGIERAALTIDAGLATDLLARLRAERAAYVPAETAT
jgi:anthranilate phosphoribosyltransferase